MLAFCDKGIVREVEIPKHDMKFINDFDVPQKVPQILLEGIYFWGQNDHQSQDMPSVSVGDVIEVEGSYHEVKPTGFREVSQEEFESMNGKRAAEAYFNGN